MWKNWITHTLLYKCKLHKLSGKQFAVSFKTKNGITIQPSSCTLGHFSQRNKNLITCRNVYKIYRSFIRNSQKSGNNLNFLQWLNG